MSKSVTVYVHGSKDNMIEAGIKLGLTGKALDMFKYACSEVKVQLQVDMKTGEAIITKVDDRRVEQAKV